MCQDGAPRSLSIRPARRDDAEVAAALLHSAYTHTLVMYPPRGQGDGEFVERLRAFFRADGNRFSYQHALVADAGVGVGVVGLVLSFGGRDEARLNAAVGPWLEREAADDEWYVDALAVFEDWGRQGIGTALMEAAEREAREHGYVRIALHVAEGNERAVGLYSRLRYVVTGRAMLYQRPHLRMVKTLGGEGTDGSGGTAA